MAISNLKLNVTANTARALADFNKFSRSLDNKFLISGLKLDVVRSSLNQITQEFQRAIGEQGLASASSFRAAQNQAAMLTQTFKGFAAESALSITENIGTALNSVVVRAGGTMKDVQKTLAATPFISTTIGDDLRDKLTKGILAAQVNMRRAGLGDNFGEVATQFLRGRVTGMQLTESGGGAEAFLGAEILKRTGGEGRIYSPQERSKVLKEILDDPEIQKQLNMMAKRSAGFKIILEDLNTKLFNPEFGVFGSLRKIVDASGKTTTMFDEVERLIGQVFGPNGMFATLVKSIQSVFGQGDLMRPLIDLVQFTTRTFKGITEFLKSSGFKDILSDVKEVFSGISDTFKDIYDQVSSGNFTTDDIVPMIRDIGTSVRDYIQSVGRFIRDLDDDEAIAAVADIGGTLLEEVGKTALTLMREIFATLVDKAPEISSAVLPAINRGINNLLDETFGGFSKVVKPLLATMPGPIGMIARASLLTDMTGGKGGLGLLAAAAPFMLAGGGGLGGMRSRLLTGTGGGATAFRTMGLGLAGLDPTLSLLGGFAPQIFGNLSGAASRFRNSQAAYTISGYLGAVGPTSRSLASKITSPLSRASVFLRSQQSQFMAGYKPLFPNIAVGGPTTRAYGAGQFMRNLPRNLSSFGSKLISDTQAMGSAINVAGRSAGSRIAGLASSLGSNFVSLGRTILISGTSAALRMQEVSRMFMLGASGQSLFSRGKTAVRLGMGFRRFAPGMLAGGAVVAGSQLLGKSIGGDKGQQISGVGSVLGSGLAGASTGAMIGSAFPGIGTAIGAAIGGVIGGIVPLMDKGTRDGVEKFRVGVVNWFNGLLVGLGEAGSRFKDYLGGGLRWLASGIISVTNGIISTLQVLPKMVMSVVNLIYSKLPKNSDLDTIIAGGNFLANYQIPQPFYSGKNVSGIAMDLERKMSGNTPMIVNDSEFVIPRGGMPVLSDAVARKLSSQSAGKSGGAVQVQVNLSLTTHSFVANADELVKALKDPVYEIIGAAWTEATTANRIYRPT